MNASMHAPLPTVDAYAPREIAQRIATLGVTKARSDAVSVLILAVLAGAFIALGALFFLVVVTRPVGGFGTTRLAGGVAFSLGLMLVVVGGGELFTGNNLVAMAWASRRITSVELFELRDFDAVELVGQRVRNLDAADRLPVAENQVVVRVAVDVIVVARADRGGQMGLGVEQDRELRPAVIERHQRSPV